MIETELKLQLTAEDEARLRRALARQAEERPRTQALRSVYHDTPGFALAEANIALRLRKVGRGWVQTAKLRPEEASRGLFAAIEVERPAPGGRLDLEGAEDALEAVRAAVNGAEVAPVFETRVKRTRARLRTASGLVEVAIDRGEVVAGALSAPIREAEFELVEGEVGAVFEAAAGLFASGPLRFSVEPKSARGLRLAREGRADPSGGPRKAGMPTYAADASVEAAARLVLRDCFAQIADNLALVADSDAAEAPHQLRIGLRRLRTALGTIRRAVGRERLAALTEEAKRIGREVGRLRDLDVLVEGVTRMAARGLEPELASALARDLEERRRAVRSELRASLAGEEGVRFVLDLASFIEAPWPAPVDGKAPATIGALGPAVLERRYRKVVKRGRRLDALDDEGLHDLRKELKRLRYSVELLAPLHSGKRQRRFLKALKELQDLFGTLNDTASARAVLDPPAEAEWRVQRGAGWVLGALAADAEAARAGLGKRWKRFAALDPFWR